MVHLEKLSDRETKHQSVVRIVKLECSWDSESKRQSVVHSVKLSARV
jgi:hypothetical protein